MRLSKSIVIISFLQLISFISNAQLGIISGKITSEGTNEAILDAKITVLGAAKGAYSDLNGDYVIRDVNPGTYTLLISAGGFQKMEMSNVVVKAKGNTNIDASLVYSVSTKQDIVVKTKVNTESSVGTTQMQYKSNVMMDIIPAELIKRSPDKTVGDALKKISGASIQDNKFAIIRGLNDRYNAAYLNDAPLPSSESDRKAFAFDIFPVNMLENLAIVKTASPDLPGEFAGGIIQIKTKNIPVENFQSISISGGYNTITTFKDRKYSKEGKLDWLGLDDGSRAMPSSIPSVLDFPSLMSDQATLAKSFQSNWKLSDATFMPNFSLQYAGGYRKEFKNKKEFGFIGSLSYNKTNNYNETTRKSFTDNTGGGGTSQIENEFFDKIYSTQLLTGSMLNLSLKLNARNSISFKNLYTINTDNRIINRTGEINPLDLNPSLLRSNANWMTINQIFSSQLSGQHAIDKDGKMKIDWMLGLSNIQRSIPNLRRNIYSRMKYVNDPSSPDYHDTMYVANISQTNVGPDYGGNMFFSNNKENMSSFKVNFTKEVYHQDSTKQEKKLKFEFKSGLFVQLRNRDFQARQLGYTKYGAVGGATNFNSNLLYLPEDSIFQIQNMGLIAPGIGGFKLSDGTKASDSYTANSQLYAGFVSIMQHFGKNKFLYGARIEDFTQNLAARRADKSPLSVHMHNLDVLPSVNFIHNFNVQKVLRVSASQTLNRPEYRELAPFAFYDFNTQFVLSGNDSLKRAKITNVDVRYEWYPGKGQIISFGTFYKYFVNPIEQITRPDVMNEISYKNVPNATNYGLEFEIKSNIGALFKLDTASKWNQFEFFTNLGFIHSVVDVSKNIGTPYDTRPLQGQSPYVLNSGIIYKTTNDFTFALNVNRVGSRMYILGSVLQPDIWEKSRTFLDFQIAKSFNEGKLELKLNCQNILAQRLIFYQNNFSSNNDVNTIQKIGNYLFTGESSGQNRFNANQDDLIWNTKFGRTISFSLTYKF